MKTISIILTSALFAVSCNNTPKSAETDSTRQAKAETPAETPVPTTPKPFDLNSLPVTDKQPGEFPFFPIPEKIKAEGPVTKEFDRLYFPLGGVMTPVEGRVYRTFLRTKDDNSGGWSMPYVEKAYGELITSAGGVKVFEDYVSKSELDRLGKDLTYTETGSLAYHDNKTTCYVVRLADSSDVFVQFSGNTAGGSLQIAHRKKP